MADSTEEIYHGCSFDAQWLTAQKKFLVWISFFDVALCWSQAQWLTAMKKFLVWISFFDVALCWSQAQWLTAMKKFSCEDIVLPKVPDIFSEKLDFAVYFTYVQLDLSKFCQGVVSVLKQDWGVVEG
ncbi:hypothetical protein J6590_050383 [Homalodisca vitripennis]|nr:hypothetical protein J6590_050383 [Homalodisca vitripennis]